MLSSDERAPVVAAMWLAMRYPDRAAGGAQGRQLEDPCRVLPLYDVCMTYRLQTSMNSPPLLDSPEHTGSLDMGKRKDLTAALAEGGQLKNKMESRA